MISLLLFVFNCLLIALLSSSDHTSTPNRFLTVSSSKPITSPNGFFELGFFGLGNDSRWYVGIGYKNIPRDYVWIANRDNPLSNSNGTLEIVDTNLVLLDQFGKHVWSSNVSIPSPRPPRSQVVAELLDNGNLVLQYSNNRNPDKVLWQSFDFPTDTLLPEMKLGWDAKSGLNRNLTSWKSKEDPASGDFVYKIDAETLGQGLPQRFLWNKEKLLHRSDTSNRVGSSGVLTTQQYKNIDYSFTVNENEVTYSFRLTERNFHSKLKISNGVLERLIWLPTKTQTWIPLWHAPTDVCDIYATCGPYSYCGTNFIPSKCKCVQGFEPRDRYAWDWGDKKDGCERKTRLSCDSDGFLRMEKMKLPNTKTAIWDIGIGLKECRKRCLKDCNCTAYANTDRGSRCLIWRTELVDLRIFTVDGENLYVRLAKSDIGGERNISRKIIGVIAAGVILLLLLCFFILFWFWKTKQRQATGILISRVNRENEEDLALPRWDFQTVFRATNHFSHSNKLGEGAFGIVYKGILLDGKQIAVKKLSKITVEGTNQFMNEARLIAKLQHLNLVRLLGYCVHITDHILIYELLENLSLDSYIFDNIQSCKLNWQRRFVITSGIAKGLQYLHEDSQFRVIHRDLKASNILLDKDMIPKISDFGMARIFERDQTEANTRTLVGTFGYMSPEYTKDGTISVKTDIYSYGVLLLEIISGKRNWKFKNSSGDTSLISSVWRNWEEGSWLETVDQCIVEDLSTMQTQEEVARCLQIGLLCVQEDPEDRPTMASVLMMLGGNAEIPRPKPPGYSVHSTGSSSSTAEESGSSSTAEESWSANNVTISVIQPR